MTSSGPAQPPEDPEHALASIRSELARIRTAAGRIERGLAELEAGAVASVRPRPRPERYLQVLVDVYDLGGRHGVSLEEWARIGAARGYERRGLGGFFTGVRAPLRHFEGRVVLTVFGERLVDEYLAELP